MIVARSRMRSLQAAGRWVATLAVAYMAYLLMNSVHGWMRGFGDDVNGDRSYSIVPVSDFLFGGVFADRLQRLLGTDNPFLVEASFQMWLSLFWLTPIMAFVAFAVGGPRSFYRLLAVHAVVVFSADVLFALFPTRPPWMDVEVVRVVSGQAGGLTGADTNPYAALPSLHVAVPVAYAVWFWRQTDPRLRACAPALTVWAAVMGFVVVYAGEHYLFCVVLGALIGVEVNLILERVHLRGLRPGHTMPGSWSRRLRHRSPRLRAQSDWASRAPERRT